MNLKPLYLQLSLTRYMSSGMIYVKSWNYQGINNIENLNLFLILIRLGLILPVTLLQIFYCLVNKNNKFVLIIICPNTEMAHFIQYHKKLTSTKLANLLLKEIVCLYRLLDSIVLDQSFIFILMFWITLYHCLKI